MNQLVEQVKHWRRIRFSMIFSLLVPLASLILAFILSSPNLLIFACILFGSFGIPALIATIFEDRAETKLEESDKLLASFFMIFPLERTQDEMIHCLHSITEMQRKHLKITFNEDNFQ